MTPPKIFPDQPEVTDKDRRTLAFAHDRVAQAWLREKPRSTDDLKKAVLVEMEHPRVRRSILDRLVIAIQRAERGEIERAIMKHLTRKTRP